MFCKECAFDRKRAVSGQGFTQFKCEKCGQLSYWHNTNTPHYCSYCSEENLICADCGKNMIVEVIENLKESTNLYEIALDIGISESSLRKYLDLGEAGPRVLNKLKEFVNEYLEEKGGSYNG